MLIAVVLWLLCNALLFWWLAHGRYWFAPRSVPKLRNEIREVCRLR